MNQTSQHAAVLRLGTRASELATSQSGWVADHLRSLGHEVELVLVQTEGDRNRAPLTQIGGTGVFVSALREALLAGEIDCAVHSLKDIPVAAAPGLVTAAVPEREDPRDVLVSRDGMSLTELPEGAVIGTGSPRRAVQLAAAAPHVTVTQIRGNVGSRINRVTSGELDAIVLAAAGLRRLGRLGEASQVLELTTMLPAPGQGALAVECRAEDAAVVQALAHLEHAPTRICVTAERALLGALEAGCSAPVGALARWDGEDVVLEAVVGPTDSLASGDAAPTPRAADSGLLVAARGQSRAVPADGGLLAGAGGQSRAVPADHGLLRHRVRGRDPVELGREMAAYFLDHLVATGDLTPPKAGSHLVATGDRFPTDPRSTIPGA
ncbi:hydroxymethylbilane synthase [Ornithinimicrobium cryptoxanthini]|uniref:Porphobilinogen deaminase n=1 Tax=Ornithinimicrobium cryptoxanthini TaxID=2934161 RepID=A0ABY4YKT7_9MICO|nr:hydroxymethylbilane synthase [Ornithinimicrobium cryptoxanthini]USQ76752.1 hydroxymethylbilane synthase [Ornithinimicrobium cryptoxanthini]